MRPSPSMHILWDGINTALPIFSLLSLSSQATINVLPTSEGKRNALFSLFPNYDQHQDKLLLCLQHAHEQILWDFDS